MLTICLITITMLKGCDLITTSEWPNRNHHSMNSHTCQPGEFTKKS